MTTRSNPNRAVLVAVARQLSPLLDDIAFVGGQVAELLVTDPAAIRIRPTQDVDVIVSAASKWEYRKVEEHLFRLGFTNDTSEDAPLCRFRTKEGHRVDVMSQNEAVLGFSNMWYSVALEQATDYRLEAGLVIRIPPEPVFLASKWAAFLNRGDGDYLGSHDMEDIISVVAGRPELLDEMSSQSRDLREWIASRSQEFLAHQDSDYALSGALPDAHLIPDLITDVRSRFQNLSKLSDDHEDQYNL